jgi:hypothetical protein
MRIPRERQLTSLGRLGSMWASLSEARKRGSESRGHMAKDAKANVLAALAPLATFGAISMRKRQPNFCRDRPEMTPQKQRLTPMPIRTKNSVAKNAMPRNAMQILSSAQNDRLPLH